MTRRYVLAVGLGLAVCTLPGCGDADGLNRGGSLSGKVLIDGKPLGGGRVELFSEDGRNAVSCQIGPDGEYKVAEPPLGTCAVVVTTSHLKGMTPPPRAKKDQKVIGSGGMVYQADVGYVYTPIPTKYESRSGTDLKVMVEKGNHIQDLTLTDRP